MENETHGLPGYGPDVELEIDLDQERELGKRMRHLKTEGWTFYMDALPGEDDEVWVMNERGERLIADGIVYWNEGTTEQWPKWSLDDIYNNEIYDWPWWKPVEKGDD